VIRAIVLKLLSVIPVLLLVSIGVFAMLHLVPGDPAAVVAGPEATAENYQHVRDQLGLDQPLWRQYSQWLSGAVRLDFGRNLIPPTEKVTTRLLRAFPVNLELLVLALVLSLAMAVPLALWSATRPGGRVDRLVSMATFGVLSVPSFLAAILLILMLAVSWKIFPLGQWARPSGHGWVANLRHAFLPALTLSMYEGAVFTRVLRSDLVSTLQEDYILAARAKGMPRWHVVWREGLRPSSFSLITVAGVSIGRLLGGTVIVERVFSLPGMGRTILDAARVHDFPVVQAGVLLIALVYIFSNLSVDILYTYLDPRIRRGRG
jgi:peptide/nickel transport system permease protein